MHGLMGRQPVSLGGWRIGILGDQKSMAGSEAASIS